MANRGSFMGGFASGFQRSLERAQDFRFKAEEDRKRDERAAKQRNHEISMRFQQNVALADYERSQNKKSITENAINYYSTISEFEKGTPEYLEGQTKFINDAQALKGVSKCSGTRR